MKKATSILTVVLMLLIAPSWAAATEQKVISYSKLNPDKKRDFFLFADSNGSYFVRNWQVDTSASWNGEGQVNLSIKQAVDYAHEYLELSPEKWGIAEVTLRPAFNHSGTIIWYYIVELIELPYKFGATSKQAVILSSGEVVLPNKV